MPKILLTGASGFLGAHLVHRLSQKFHLFGTIYHSPIPSGIRHPASVIKLDITNYRGVIASVEKINPDVIIHTAANTNLRDCEENPKGAWALNVEGTKNLAAKEINARFIYLSTDTVFDGTGQFCKETDTPNPFNVYGKTKLEGENVVTSLLPNAVTLRLALLYGWSLTRSTTFTEDLIKELEQDKPIRAFTDEYRTPLHVENLCEIIEEIIEHPTIKGLSHVAGPDRVNRYEQALRIAEIFNLDTSLISPITTTEIKSLNYNRPKDCSLNTEKLQSVIKTRIWSLDKGLNVMHETL